MPFTVLNNIVLASNLKTAQKYSIPFEARKLAPISGAHANNLFSIYRQKQKFKFTLEIGKKWETSAKQPVGREPTLALFINLSTT